MERRTIANPAKRERERGAEGGREKERVKTYCAFVSVKAICAKWIAVIKRQHSLPR